MNLTERQRFLLQEALPFAQQEVADGLSKDLAGCFERVVHLVHGTKVVRDAFYGFFFTEEALRTHPDYAAFLTYPLPQEPSFGVHLAMKFLDRQDALQGFVTEFLAEKGGVR